MHYGGHHRSESCRVRIGIQLAFIDCPAQPFFEDGVERIQAFPEYPTHCWSMHGLDRGGSNKEAAAGCAHGGQVGVGRLREDIGQLGSQSARTDQDLAEGVRTGVPVALERRDIERLLVPKGAGKAGSGHLCRFAQGIERGRRETDRPEEVVRMLKGLFPIIFDGSPAPAHFYSAPHKKLDSPSIICENA